MKGRAEICGARKIRLAAACVLLVAALAGGGACTTLSGSGAVDPFATAVRVEEAWETERRPAENIDSVAVWHGARDDESGAGAGGEAWLLATAKDTDRLVIYDAATGEARRDFGASGAAAGEFRRPNGIAVLDDLAFVVERDNGRVQVLRLPGLESLGFIAEGDLDYPYGLTVAAAGDGYDLWVTDNYDRATDPDLSRRVRRYSVALDGGGEGVGLVVKPGAIFGDAEGPGALYKVETLLVDPAHDRLLVADEEETRMGLREYSPDGTFRNRVVGDFHFEPEGLALYACEGGDGYWLATDQGKGLSLFRVLDRRTLEPLGSFTGVVTAHTDGVWLTTRASATFPAGAFYAVHDDQSVTAFDWRDIAAALDLRQDCASLADGSLPPAETSSKGPEQP